MSKKGTLISGIISCLLTFSCDPQLNLPAEISPTQEEKTAAWNSYQQAREDFFDQLANKDQPSVNQDYSEEEMITGLAWEAYLSGDQQPLWNYLEERNLVNTYNKVSKDYHIPEASRILSQPSSSRYNTSNFFDAYLDGDVFVSYNKENSGSKIIGFLIPGHWKHAGMMDRTRPWNGDPNLCVLSAGMSTSHGFAVGYESRSKWAAATAMGALRIKGRTQEAGRGALDYCRKYIGRPYSVFTGRNSNDKWYCSKVVWRGWKSQGKDLEFNNWRYWRGQWVTPQDIWRDEDTYFIGGDCY